MDREEILELVQAAGALEEVEEIARRYGDEARELLEIFPPSPAREALEYAPEYVLNRRS